jgi:actin-like ATPase involved in cell morphogenesis
MPYYLGVDVGTTYTAAAVWRDGRVEVASLGLRAPVVPTLVYVTDEGMLVGEAAQRRALGDPSGLAREFKRRVGDPTPVVLGGTGYPAEALMARMLAWVVDTVTAQEGGPPAAVGVSHPANWGTYKKDLLAAAIEDAAIPQVPDVTMVTEPQAAAVHYASQERVGPGTVVAVYDLGGGTFDVALLRKIDKGWEILGEPEGIERLGGVDFDEAVFRHVVASTGDALEGLDEDDPKVLAAVARLRRECVDAKEALSSDSHVSIPVLLPPQVQAEVRLTRSEFEQMIRPPLSDSIEALRRALRSAKVEVADIDQVLLVGGSSRIPLVASLVSSELGRPVAIDTHPKYAVALGTAVLAAEHASADPVLTSQVVIPVPAPVPAEDEPAPALPDAQDLAAGLAALVGTPEPAPAPSPAPAPERGAGVAARSRAGASPGGAATELIAPVRPEPPPRPPKPERETRKVYVPAPAAPPPSPVTPVPPSRGRSGSGGHNAAAQGAPVRARHRKRGFLDRLTRTFVVLLVLASLAVAGLLALEVTNPDAIPPEIRDLYAGK